MARTLRDQVVVVTGASSGIGRATALAFARRGARLVLAARRADPLAETAAECGRVGAGALAVPIDVRDEGMVQALAQRAVEQFGRLDVWVNNAGVTMFGRIEDGPSEAYRQVVETNLMGCVHGSRAAMQVFRAQGSGVLINVASQNGRVASPYVSAYVATKFAIVGLSESLRQEALDNPRIHVCTVLPASIDTPLFQHAANFTGRAIKPLEPIYDAALVARAIVRCAEHPRREVVVGTAGRVLGALRTLAPAAGERLMARTVDRDHFLDRTVQPTSGNLFDPVGFGTGVSGGWRAPENGRARWLLGVPLAAAGLGVVAWSLLRGPASEMAAQAGRRAGGLVDAWRERGMARLADGGAERVARRGVRRLGEAVRAIAG